MQQSIIVGVIGGLLISSTTIQAAVGGAYDAREPRTCPSRKEPSRGALSSQQAIQYFACDTEGIYVGQLYLATDINIDVAPKPRRFNVATDSFSGIDPSQPVFDIRGSYTRYQCSKPDSTLAPKGRNCDLTPQPQATGICYKDTFSDWHCRMSDVAHASDRKSHVPPPLPRQ